MWEDEWRVGVEKAGNIILEAKMDQSSGLKHFPKQFSLLGAPALLPHFSFTVDSRKKTN